MSIEADLGGGHRVAKIAGVDGCKGGWICIEKETANSHVTATVYRTAEEMFQAAREMVFLAIDIPIGLTDAGPRACDIAARKFLGPKRSSSVFPAPVRAALSAQTWEEASVLSRAAHGKSLSRQSFGILPKIREVDTLLRESPALQGICHEVHPEVSFSLWNGGRAMSFSKKAVRGRQEREALVLQHFGSRFNEICASIPRSQAAIDDILDAFAAVWTAERYVLGQATVLPSDAPQDRFGLPMAITG